MDSEFRLTDRSAILAFLETDRLYAGYAIGDLEAGLFEQCEWYGAGAEVLGAAGRSRPSDGASARPTVHQPRRDLVALVLVFHGFKPPVLFLIGDGDALGGILPTISLPQRVYLNCRAEHVAAAGLVCTWSALTPMWRMVLEVQTIDPAPPDCVPLGPSDAGRLAELYAAGGGEAFSPDQMEHGVYCGVVRGGRIVAAAGTHLVSDTHAVAAVGNVFTHPDWRGQGLGGAVTRAVIACLRLRGMRDIILNVGQSNCIAVGLYERLGFRRHCAFLEGEAQTRGPKRPSIRGSRGAEGMS